MEPVTKKRKLSGSEAQPVITIQEGTQEQDKRQSLFVRSLPASVTKERLVEHFSQSYALKHATVVLDPTTKTSRGFGFVTFTDPEDAQAALLEFNNSVLDGRKIKVEAAEARNRETQEGLEGKGSSKNIKGEELRAKRQQQQDDNQPPKLIVRNLPWSIKTAEDLTKLFLSYGKVKHAVVPNLSGKKDTQAGFGIVIIRGKKNAERALQGVNGKVVDGRTLAVDWAVDKETWQKLAKEEATQAHEQANGDSSENPVEPLDDEVNGGVVVGEGNSELVDDEELDNETAAEGASEADEEEEDEELDQADLSADDISELAAEDDADTAPSSKYNTENTTVFLRNLAYDVDDEALSEHFTSNFGPVRYARVVYDHDTERSRGTGFVCFRNEDDAKACVKNCPKQEPTTASSYGKQQAPSLLQNENSDPSGKYTLASRLLNITRALPKPEADSRASESAKTRLAKQQSDKRHLYLLSEGTVSPGSSLYSTLSKTELDIRSASAKQRQKLVKSNPNLGLSMTRLSVRNLPRWIDGKALKLLAREAIVGFAGDVKSGVRQPVSKEELARDGEIGRQAEKQRKEQGKGVVRQAKIVYESDKTGTKIGEGKGGRSRGYGFIEYWGHRSALMGLRWLNGHLVKKPKEIKAEDDDGERGKRLIVEFAIENAQVVQRRSDREKRVKSRRSKEEEEEEAPADRNRKTGGKFDRTQKTSGKFDRHDKKRKRDAKDVGDTSRSKKREPASAMGKTEIQAVDQDEKNKIAARNRIIAQKRQKRRTRRG